MKMFLRCLTFFLVFWFGGNMALSMNYFGDRERAKDFEGIAKMLLYKLENRKKLGNLKQIWDQHTFTDGTVIRMESIYDKQTVWITSPFVKPPKVEEEQVKMGQYVIAYYENSTGNGQYRVWIDGAWKHFNDLPYNQMWDKPGSYGFDGITGQRMALHSSGKVIVGDTWWDLEGAAYRQYCSVKVSKNWGRTFGETINIASWYDMWQSPVIDVGIDEIGDFYVLVGGYEVGWSVYKSENGVDFTEIKTVVADATEYTGDAALGISKGNYVFATQINPALGHDDAVVWTKDTSTTLDSYDHHPIAEMVNDTWCLISNAQKVTTQTVDYFVGGDGNYHAIDPFGSCEWSFYAAAWHVYSGTPVASISGVPEVSPIVFTNSENSNTIVRNGDIVWQGDSTLTTDDTRQFDLRGDSKLKYWVAAPRRLSSEGAYSWSGDTVGIILSVDDGKTFNLIPVDGCVVGPIHNSYDPKVGISVDISGSKIVVAKAEYRPYSWTGAAYSLQIFVGTINKADNTVNNWVKILDESRNGGYADGLPSSVRIVKMEERASDR